MGVHGGIGPFEWNIRTGVNTWTPELEAMYGLPPGGFSGTQTAWENRVHPDDCPEVIQLVKGVENWTTDAGRMARGVARQRISGSVIKWARTRLGKTHEQIADEIGSSLRAEDIAQWEAGENLPEFRKAQKLALALHIPFGYLFLSDPPKNDIKVPDLRTVGSKPIIEFSFNLQDQLRNLLLKQEGYRDHATEEGRKPLGDVEGAFSWLQQAADQADVRLRFVPVDSRWRELNRSERLRKLWPPPQRHLQHGTRSSP